MYFGLPAKHFLIYLLVMDKIINKVLREYIKDDVVLRRVGSVDPIYFKILEEDKKKSKIEIPIQARPILDGYLRKINPFYGTYQDKNKGTEGRIKFNIKYDTHYLERLFRLSDPEYQEGGKFYNSRIMNPKYLEGFDFIKNAADKFAQQIYLRNIDDGDIVEATAVSDGKLYSVIVKMNEFKDREPSYTLYLKTQIKGVPFFGKKHQKRIRLN
jgi:hypothetical protein